jgi:hypothetical protein
VARASTTFIHLTARNRLRGLSDQRFPARLFRTVLLRDQFHLHIWQRFRPHQGINKCTSLRSIAALCGVIYDNKA